MSGFFKRIQSFFGFESEDEDESGGHEIIRDNRTGERYTRSAEISGRSIRDREKSIKERHGRIFTPAGRRNEPAEQAETNPGIIPRKKVSFLTGSRDQKGISSVLVSAPKEFEEIQAIADSFKLNVPVIINLQNTDADLSKRVVDFCSGLSYALEGNIKKVGDKVFLITPCNVEINSNENQLLKENGIFDPYGSLGD